MNIEIYTRNDPPCVYCESAKMFLDQREIKYKNHTVGEDLTREELLEQFPGIRTVPVVLIDGQVIGGFTEMKNHFLSKALGGMTL